MQYMHDMLHEILKFPVGYMYMLEIPESSG